MTLRILVATSGVRYPPGFLSMRMNSMSFLITAFGSYGLPRKLDPFSTSYTALEILCQLMGARLSKPMARQCSWIDAWRGTTVCLPPFCLRDKQTPPTAQLHRPPAANALKQYSQTLASSERKVS